ncbi:MAG: phosphatase PAP2-related protein [Candidatus Paceibacterota bacterium]
MKTLTKKYKLYLSNKSFMLSSFLGLVFILISLVINYYAGTYASESASSPVQDIILSNTPVFNMNTIFIYGPLILWFYVTLLCVHEPKRIPFILKSIALFVIIRSVFLTMTHIGPYPDQIALNPESWINNFTFGADLFFSAHTGLPFLLALIFEKNKILKIFFIANAVFFGAVVLLGHLHYTIDVFAAFFITYSIHHIAEKFFEKDRKMFYEGVRS